MYRDDDQLYICPLSKFKYTAYTMSWAISTIWLWDLWTYHRDSKGKVSFDKQNSVSQADDNKESPEDQAPSQTVNVEMNDQDNSANQESS